MTTLSAPQMAPASLAAAAYAWHRFQLACSSGDQKRNRILLLINNEGN